MRVCLSGLLAGGFLSVVFVAAAPTVFPELPVPVRVLHVAPGGSDESLGDQEHPLGTLEGARDRVRAWRKAGETVRGAIEVRVHGGVFRVGDTFRLTAEDSGTAGSPVVYRGEGDVDPVFSGGVVLGEARSLEMAAAPERLPREVVGEVLVWELGDLVAGDLPPFELGGFSSGRGFGTHPAVELFVNGEPMVWARWPDEGFVKTVDVVGPLTLGAWDNKKGTREGRFVYEGDRPSRWVGEPDGWLYGYWFWDWADSYEKIESIDVAKKVITLAKPWHQYGFRKEQRYFAVNMLSELDAPGEWYLDRASRRVYLYPKGDLSDAKVELSWLAEPMVQADGVSHVRLEGLTWELGGADGLQVRGGEGFEVVGCTVRKLGGNGIEVRGGRGHVVRSCDIHTLGRGGVILAGGDRKSLTAGEHLLENNHIHHLSRVDHTYTPGVLLEGVGNRVRHNRIHHVASSAMRVGGNDHLVELNEVHHVVLESDDQGGVDMWGNATFRGNVYRHNYWHHMGNWEGEGEEAHTGQAGVRLDDAISGVLVEGNVFHRCSAGAVGFGGVQIHGGKDNVIEGNLFADCRAAVSFTRWGEKRWREFVANVWERPDVDRELYVERYPALRTLAEDADVNTVRGNVTLRCGGLLLRASPETVQMEGNREFGEVGALPEGEDGLLVWDSEVADRLGLGDIPFSEMGLYADGYRRER